MLHISRLKTLVWYGGVGLLLLLAVAATLFRLYFSSVGEYRAQLEELAGDYLGQPVTISGMDTRVVGISPTVILRDVALLQQGDEALLTRFDSVSIALDPIASLRHGSPIIELAVSGADLEVTRYLDGTFGVKGVVLPAREEKGAGEDGGGTDMVETGKALGGWFLSQSRLAVRDSRISLHNEESGERFSFNKVELELRNDGARHRLNGMVHLPKAIGKELRLAADIEGDPLQSQEWRGALYVKTVQLQPRQWLQQVAWRGSSLREGRLDLELWGSWQHGKLASLSTRLHASDLVVARGEQRRAIPRLSADARLLRQDAGWRLDVAGLQLRLGEAAPLPTRLTLTQDDGELALQADRLQLEVAAALLPFVPQLDARWGEMVRQMSPGGEVTGLYLRQVTGQQPEVQGKLQGVVLHPWERLPGVSGLDAEFRFNGVDGELQLHGSEMALTLPQLFREPIKLQRLQGELRLRREADGWRLLTDSLSLANRDLAAELGLELQLREDSAPWLSLQGRFSAPDARAVPRYLPAGIMNEQSLHWLDNAFKAGRVPAGTLQYHGFLNHFPFSEERGRFEVLFDAEAVQLHYHDGWPELQQLAGEVHFDGPGMWITARGARLYDAQLGDTTVSIDNFRAPRLLVDGVASPSIGDGLRFLRESPLAKNGGKLPATLQGQGDVALRLQLALPLSEQVRDTLPLTVNGRVDFSGNRLAVVEGVTLHGLGGTLHFTERSFRADKLTAELFGQPASLAVSTAEGENPAVQVAAHGRAAVLALRKAFRLPLFDYLEGESTWQMLLTLPRGAAAKGVELQISSNLAGVSSTLPEPLAKGGGESRELRFTSYLGGARSGESQLILDDDFGLVWRQGSGAGEGLRRAQLRLGGGDALRLPGRDVIEVVGEGARLRLGPWREVLRKLQGEGGAARQPLPLVVRMQQLQLLGDSSAGESAPLKVAAVPAITLEVGQFAYDELQLGKVAMNIIPRENSLSMQGIRIESPHFALNGEGSWSEGGSTLFTIKLDSPDLGAMMQQLGFASVFQGGKSHATGKVWWLGSPTALTLAGLNAQLGVSIEDGTIVDVDPGAGRMLGLLSVPALPRRLFLDFSDVFKKGLAFTLVKGDIRIEQGQAYTSNLRLESVPAGILITGRTGLVAQDFDQDIYVVPNVSDTVSVASALAWGPQVAAVVMLLQEIFKSDIKAATMSRYHLSGSWSKPLIRRIAEPGQKVDTPLFGE
jgi:uncharacterized protein (TIGR02099 family)